mmetsp:Transcript_71283/g.185870  ORF Transcript_71283/g.185870 Transcript_71283/m.185870 type:complete len:224 (-) Transcript_71283:333-1004(-)
MPRQLACIFRGRVLEHLVPRQRRNTWCEGVPRVARVHCLEILGCRRTDYLDDLHQLIDTVATCEQGLAQYHLPQDTPCRPEVDAGAVGGGPQDELWGPVIPAAHVRCERSADVQPLRGAEVGHLQRVRPAVQQEILRLYVAMHYAQPVNKAHRAQKLILIQLDVVLIHVLPAHVHVVFQDAVQRVRHVLEHQVERVLLLVLAVGRRGQERAAKVHHVRVPVQL